MTPCASFLETWCTALGPNIGRSVCPSWTAGCKDRKAAGKCPFRPMPPRPRKIPVVLTRSELDRLFACLHGEHRLMARLLYGSGLRLMDCLRLRVKDIDLERRQII